MFDDLIALCLAASRPALPQDWWTAWSLAPATLVPLAAGLAWMLRRPHAAGQPWQWAGWSLLALALVSPLCRLAATLASAHMAQLMVLIAGAALLAHGAGAPRRARAQHPAAAAAVHGAVLWLWHVPAVYALVLQQPAAHLLAYALLVGSAWWFWRSLLQAPAAQRATALLALLATMAHTGLLGALLTFSATPLYPLQAAGARAWGLSALHDQQLAGLLMWVVGGLAYLALAVVAVLRVGMDRPQPAAVVPRPSQGMTRM